ncbi:hypothetical protein Bca101_027445 [Brassica carinata]
MTIKHKKEHYFRCLSNVTLFFFFAQTNPCLCQSRVHSRRLQAAEPLFLKPKRQYCVKMDRKREDS